LGHTMAKVTLHSPDMARSEQTELLVDTESTYTQVPNVVLERLSVQAMTARKFKTIDGRLLERKVGHEKMDVCIGDSWSSSFSVIMP